MASSIMASQGESAKESKRYMKMTVFFNKNPNLTDEEFHRYWSEEHGALFTSLRIVQEKILKYNQFHNSMEARQRAASIGLPVMEFDAAAEIWGVDMDAVLSLFEDPEYQKKVVPDEEKFATREGCKVMFGYDVLKIDRTS